MFLDLAPLSALVAIHGNLFHGVVGLWSVSLDPPVFRALPRSGGAVLFIGFLPRSDLRFPLATGSPYGTSQSA